ncbi:Holliday junction branch migration protein RuvA [Moraxella osloensis]|uniref:Holliday junction branch migration complex subunit RuvA n=1 Tax=Faucicola osloensis TaxID=34062 RepID=A0A2D2LUE5_FAUOS|nr:Holliday junction branch migration protein RuvA [Moraxella osloensis]ATR78647.1 Holliday junction branch migration protein RuvA [Moraxella osloensis]
MIGLIQGQVHHLMAPTVVVMTTAGVGYEIEMPLNAFCQVQLNQSVTLWTHFLVREDAQLLFGFLSHSDREVFRLLLKVNGVGAKMALAMMSTVTVQELHQFVMNNDELALTRIPGVGKKTAQRLIVELKDKIKHLGDTSGFAPSLPLATDSGNEGIIIAEVEAGLIALGYRDKEAQAAIKLAKSAIDLPLTIQNLLKASLKNLAMN